MNQLPNEVLIGRIDERTIAIQIDLSDLKKEMKETTDYLSSRDNLQERDLAALVAQHNERVRSGANCATNQTLTALPKGILALISSAGGTVGAAIVLVMLLLLRSWGFI